MKPRTMIIVAAALLCASTVAPAARAQSNNDRNNNNDQHQANDYSHAFALGAGVIEPDSTGEIYYYGGLRFRLHGDEDRTPQKGDWRYERRGDIVAFIEPEVGYWQSDNSGIKESDFSAGVNGIGVIPGRTVDYFFGVGLGVHFLDTKIAATQNRGSFNNSDQHVGGNFQVGLDIRMSRSVSLFGTGRFDIIEGVSNTLQGKVYMGLRFRF